MINKGKSQKENKMKTYKTVAYETAVSVLEARLLIIGSCLYVNVHSVADHIPSEYRQVWFDMDGYSEDAFVKCVNDHIYLLKGELLATLKDCRTVEKVNVAKVS